jgi:hypothetical protein
MENTRSDAFAPANPPAPPVSGFAEVVGGELPRIMDAQLEEEYTVAMMADEGEMDLTIPTVAVSAPVASVAKVVTDKAETPVVSGETYKKAKRFHADAPAVLSLLLILIASMAAASFYISFSGLYAAAEWAVGPNPPLQFAVPIMLDISIIAFTIALFIERERGEKVLGTWMAIGAFTAVSLVANVLHTFVVSTAEDQYQLIVGAVISGGAPLLLAFATDKIAVKVFKSAEKAST